MFVACRTHALTQPGVGDHPAAQEDRPDAVRGGGLDRLGHLDIDHGFLERRRQIGNVQLAPRVALGLHVPHDRGLQAAQGEIQIARAHHRPREFHRVGIAVLGEPVERGAAREPQAHRARDLVEGLPRGVVERLPEKFVPVLGRHVDKHRVTARHDQSDVRRVRVTVLQEVRIDVSFQMIHADERDVAGQRDRLAGGQAHQQRPDQTGPDGRRHSVQVTEPDPRLLQRLLEHRVERLDVRPGGDLRYDPAEACVQIDLTGDEVAEDGASVLHHGDCRLVARCLDPEDPHTCSPPAEPNRATMSSPIASIRSRCAWVCTPSNHMTSASSFTST